MKKLSTLFDEERHQLQTEIDKVTSVDQVVKLVQNQIDHLEKSYISELNMAQVRSAAFFLDALRQSIATLTAANQIQVTLPQSKQVTIPVTKLSANRLILKLLKTLVYIGILAWLLYLTETSPGAWMAILLASVLIGLEVVLQLDKDKQDNNSNFAQLRELPQSVLKIDSKILLDNLGDALNTIDLAVARVEQGNQSLDDRAIEELPELLNFLQRLIGASFLDKPQMMLELTKLLPQILMEQGIRTQVYQPKDPHSDREYFDFEPSIDPDTKNFVTITPALLKGDRLLRRGRVIEPFPT
ncbi:MAG: hypothetical protein KME28_01950 [Pelatocladus maniniholoensis HA4357-MV3]|jgi:hypothetical protein|uniref:Uncharacterized protein n=1 Tax=Pelatocladus maniniholoensis HA4357-MV3 TaxID=1117104 RepID=A0A9E3LQP8_9NOST|nr:hypothetical protein [Pelatocladus maniniholoensis HA4357-MV3]BAZ70529.1 hypothetical protein NIES4106_53240 [Fischerella sp. NIES-4106]